MYILYTVPPSLYCAKVRIVFRHKQLQWEERPPPGGYDSKEYKRLVASGNLPALQDGRLLLADSEAIAEYVNEKCPTPPMLPDDIASRARVRERSRFHDTRLEPALRALFAHLSPTKRDKLFVDRQVEQLNARLDQLAKLLALPLTDQFDNLSLADCGLPITCAWIDAITPIFNARIHWPQAVIRERERLLRFDAVASELSDYEPRLVEYLDTVVTA